MKIRFARLAVPVAVLAMALPAMASPALADPWPVTTRCNGPAQLTPSIKGQVCISVLRAYQQYTSSATITNTGSTPLTINLRVDVLSGDAIHYGNACSGTKNPGESVFCSGLILTNPPRPIQSRARIDAPGYSEYIFSPQFT